MVGRRSQARLSHPTGLGAAPVAAHHTWRVLAHYYSACQPFSNRSGALRRFVAESSRRRREQLREGSQVQRVVDYFVYLLLRGFICALQALKMETCQVVTAGLATLFTSVLKVRFAVLDGNLRQAFPNMLPAERRQIAWRMWDHPFTLIVEIAHAPRKIHETNWRDFVTLHNADVVT